MAFLASARAAGRCARILDEVALQSGVQLERVQSEKTDAGSKPARAHLSGWQVKRCLRMITARIAEDLTLNDLAREARLSPAHFARAFRATLGLPPCRYLMLKRIEKSRTLLKTTALSVADVAAQVGYHDPGYFSRSFRRELGISPTAYRREKKTFSR